MGVFPVNHCEILSSQPQTFGLDSSTEKWFRNCYLSSETTIRLLLTALLLSGYVVFI